MPATHLARVVATALALVAATPAAAGAWPGRSHFGGDRSWLFARDSGVRSLPAGDGPETVLFDAATRRLYVTNDTSNDVVVIDASGRSSRIPVGAFPIGMALRGHTLYVANAGDGTVSVIETTRGSVIATVNVGGAPVGIAVDPASGTVYAADPDNAMLRMFDGDTCPRACATVTASAGGAFPLVDAATHTLYLPRADGTATAVYDTRACNVHAGCGAPAATVESGPTPVMALLDPATRTLYVTDEDGGVSVVDAASCNASDTSGCGRGAVARTAVAAEPNSNLALDRATRTLYVPGTASDVVSAVDADRCNARVTAGCGTRWPTLATGNEPFWIDLDPETGTLYVPAFNDDAVDVLDGRGCTARRRTSCRDEAPSQFIDDASFVAISQKARTAYVTHANLHDLVMFDTSRCSARTPDGCTPVVGPVAGVSGPYDIAFDPGTDTLYATNQDDRTLVLIDPATCNARRPRGCAPAAPAIRLPHALHVDVDVRSHAVYVTSYDDNSVAVIDGRHCRIGDVSGCTPAIVPGASGAWGVAADPLTGTAYVSNINAAEVSVVAGGRVRATVAVGGPGPQLLAVDAARRTLYVTHGPGEGGGLSAIDLRACNGRDTSGCGRPPKELETGRLPVSVAVDPVTHDVYTADYLHSTASVIHDGRRVDSVPVGFNPLDVAVDPVAKTVYVVDSFEGRVSFVAAR